MKTTLLSLNRDPLHCSAIVRTARWLRGHLRAANLAKRLECAQLAAALGLSGTSDSGSKLRALQTLARRSVAALRLCGEQPPIALTLLLAALAFPASPARAATNDLTTALQRGLFEEEANQNLGAAIQAYQSVASQFDKDRKLAATAIFRLGECYRKQGNTNDAATFYERILREFSDQPTLVTLSRQNLAGIGITSLAAAAPVLSDAARQQQRLLEQQIKLVEKRQAELATHLESPTVRDELAGTEMELLRLKSLLAALNSGQPVSVGDANATANAAAAAQAESLALESQLAALKGLPKDKLRIAVQQNYPNPILTSLIQKLTEAEQNHTTLRGKYGPRSVEMQTAEDLVVTILKQVDAQVDSVLQGLQIKRDVAKRTAEMLAVQAGKAQPAAEQLGSSGLPVASTDADEVKRIQALIKDSPDLINAPDTTGETLLQSAAAKGKLAVVKVLLDNGAAVDGLQQPGLTALHYAAANGHKAVVDLLLSKGAKADAQTDTGLTPLHLAAQKGYEAVAKSLLAAGAPVNAQTKDRSVGRGELALSKVHSGETPLHLAARGGYSSLAQLLLAKGADANSKDVSGKIPLHEAAAAGYTGLVEMLLAKGADANAEDGMGRTPLSYAAARSRQAVIQALLAAHASPNAGQVDLPVAEAAYYGDLPTLKLLLANGADPNTNAMVRWGINARGYNLPSGGKFTPLFLAVNQRHADAVEELLRCKANPNPLGSGPNPFLYEALSDAPTLKVLIEGDADPNGRTSDGSSPLLLQAVIDNNQPAVELLLAHQANVNCTNKDGWTPLHYAAGLGNKPIAELLLKAGASVNAKNSGDETPLRLAVNQGKAEVVELLLANKADPNVKDNGGWTPLHTAVRNGKPEMVELLLANKADPNERDNSGQTPLDVVKNPITGGLTPPLRTALADLLRQHGAADDLPRLDCISLRRPSANYFRQVFTKGTNDWNQFTLFELIAVQYNFLAASPWGDSVPANAQNQISQPLPFPDFVRLRVRRPGREPKDWDQRTIDIRRALETTNCSADVRLEWGDVVEIPEADHPLDERWSGFPTLQFAALEKCLRRQVELVIKGQATNLTLAPRTAFLRANFGPANKAAFWIRPVLRNSGLMLASSDLSQVKVTRRDPATGQERQWVLDCMDGSPAPPFWLRDGDKIEVPEKKE